MAGTLCSGLVIARRQSNPVILSVAKDPQTLRNAWGLLRPSGSQ